MRQIWENNKINDALICTKYSQSFNNLYVFMIFWKDKIHFHNKSIKLSSSYNVSYSYQLIYKTRNGEWLWPMENILDIMRVNILMKDDDFIRNISSLNNNIVMED